MDFLKRIFKRESSDEKNERLLKEVIEIDKKILKSPKETDKS